MKLGKYCWWLSSEIWAARDKCSSQTVRERATSKTFLVCLKWPVRPPQALLLKGIRLPASAMFKIRLHVLSQSERTLRPDTSNYLRTGGRGWHRPDDRGYDNRDWSNSVEFWSTARTQHKPGTTQRFGVTQELHCWLWCALGFNSKWYRCVDPLKRNHVCRTSFPLSYLFLWSNPSCLSFNLTWFDHRLWKAVAPTSRKSFFSTRSELIRPTQPVLAIGAGGN